MERHAAGSASPPRRGSPGAGTRARSGLGAESRRDPAGRQRLHDSLPGKSAIKSIARRLCPACGAAEGTAGEPAGRQSSCRALRQARAGVEALSHGQPQSERPQLQESPGGTRCGTAAEKAPRQSSSPQAKQRLDGGFRSEKEPACCGRRREASGARRAAAPAEYAELGVAAKPRLLFGAPGKRRRCAELAVALSKPKALSSETSPKQSPPRTHRPAVGGAQGLAAPQLRQGGAAESTTTKPSDRQRQRVVSLQPLASEPAPSLRPRASQEPARPGPRQPTTLPPPLQPAGLKPDISAWQRIGHFYLALTTRGSDRDKTRRGIRGSAGVYCRRARAKMEILV